MDKAERNREEGHPWLSWAVVGLLLIVALALRWRYVREISLFVDEFVTAWAARSVLARGLPIFPSGNVYPHGITFTYLEAPFVLGPFNETLARLPGLLVSLLGLPIAYWVGRRLFSDQVGLIAAAAMAVDPDCIVWGGRARMYGLLQLLSLLVVYFYYRGLAGDRPRDRYLAMGLLVAAIFTHLEAAFLLPVLGLATLVAWPPRRLLRWSAVLPFVLGVAGAVAFYLLAKYGQPGHLEILDKEGRSYLDLSLDLLSGPRAFAPAFSSLHRFPFSLLAVAGLYWLFRPRFDRRSPLLYLYVVLFTFLAVLVLLAGATWERDRYLFLILPLFFLISGEALSRFLGLIPALRRPRPWQAAVVALAVAAFVGLTGAGTAYVQEWGYDRAFRYLQDRWQPDAGDQIATAMSAASMLYLGQDDAFTIQKAYEEYVVPRPGDARPVDLWTATPILTTTAAFTDLLTSAPRLWFVTDGWRFQTRYDPDFILTALDQMDLEYNERGVMVFRGEGYTPLAEPAFRRQRRADFGREMALTGFGLSGAHPNPGDELEITLDWQALEQVGPAYTAFLHLVRADGTGVAGVDEPVLRGLYQPDLWPQGATLSDRHHLALPPDLPPGRYRLDLGLYRPGQPDQPLPVQGSNRLPLASLTVGETAASPPSVRTDVDFGGQIRLLGYDLRQAAASIAITLHWQALAPMDRDYTVFVHLVASNAGETPIIAQHDAPPGDPFFPTSTWLPGDAVLDPHELTPPAGTPAGDYTLLVGLYYLPSGERLQAVDAGGNPLGDALPLTTIAIGSESP
jgi:4-amino-4-deoxy-L-arabinose transferase-like glycosyltransferase